MRNADFHCQTLSSNCPIEVPSTPILRESAGRPCAMEPTQTAGYNILSEVSFQESSNTTVTWPVFSNTALLLLCALN